MPAKPLTLIQARPLLKALYPDDRIQVFEPFGAVPAKAAYFNEEPAAKFWGETWEEVLEAALKTKYLTP